MKKKEIVRDSIIQKLHPTVFQMSTFLRSILGCFLQEDWTEPRLYFVVFDKDGDMFGLERLDGSLHRLPCNRSSLRDTLLGLAEVANLTPKERTYLLEFLPPSLMVRSKKNAKPRKENGNSPDL